MDRHYENAILMNRCLTGHALLGDLSVIDLFLQSVVTDKAVNVTDFLLTIAVHPTHCLGVVTGVPGGIKHDNTVSSDEVYPQTARPKRQHSRLKM